MIQVKIVLDEAGLLRSCEVEGHAGAGKKGNDIVCAAVSVLTRTVVRVLAGGEPSPDQLKWSGSAEGRGRKGITIRGSIPGQGNFQMEADYTEEGKEFLAATGAYLCEGLLSVAEEFPGNCKINIERRNNNGT